VSMQPADFDELSRRTQEILRESEDRFRLLVEGVKDYAIFMLDTDGYITTWNLGAQRIKGYEAEEIIGEHFSIFYTDEDVEREHPEEELRIAATEGQYEEERIRVRKDGSHFWASVLITALRDEEGDLRGFAKVTRDITLRKEAEERERLLAQEQAAREWATDTLERISDAFYAVDGGWRFTYINSKAEELWGRSRDELVGKNIWEEFPQAVGSQSCRQIKRAMEERATTEFETICPILGTWVAGRVYPSRDGLSVYFQDITELKRAMEEHTRLASIIEASDDAIISKTLDGIITSWNRGAQRLYGYSVEEALGSSISILVPPESPGEVAEILETIRRGERVEHYETVRVTKDGERRDISLTVSPIKDAQGQVVGASTIARDITERKKAERRLRETERRYRTLVEQIPAITYVQEPVESDNPKAVTYMSPQYETMLGYPAESEMIDEEHWRMTLHPEDRERVMAEEIRTDETGEPFKIEYRIIAADGRPIWVRDEATLVRDGQERPLYWLGVQYDITERKRAEEALREVREVERSRLARDLHDGVLQDLSYTTAALGLVMLQVEDTKLKEHLQAAVDAIRRGARSLREVVNDLRLEDEEDRPLPVIVESLVRRNQMMVRGSQIRLEVEAGFPSVPLGETGTQISRIIQEALTNGRRHSGAKRISVSLKMVEGDLLVEVSDNGRGFGPETPPGVGLGSMRERAALIGGELEMESAPGRGTEVRLTVPLPEGVLE
jgi:PAS domain S-box-containing protein